MLTINTFDLYDRSKGSYVTFYTNKFDIQSEIKEEGHGYQKQP
jgi:hypothetical protein